MMLANRKLLGSHWQTLTFRSLRMMENKPPRALQSRSAATTELDESMAAEAVGSEVGDHFTNLGSARWQKISKCKVQRCYDAALQSRDVGLHFQLRCFKTAKRENKYEYRLQW